MKQKVVIIGYCFSTRLCLARTLGSLGYDVSIIALEPTKSKPIDCYSKYVKSYFYTQGDSEEKILHILLNNFKDEKQKVILIPINDFSASVLDKNQNLLSKYFLYQHIQHRQGAIVEWMNKEKQKKLAQQIGLNVARSIDIEIVNKKYELPDDIHYPCFTKTKSFTTGYKHTLHRCDDEGQLRNALDDMCKEFDNLSLLVEDFKNIEKEYAVVGISNGKEVIIPSVIEILSMANGSDKGIALQGRIVSCQGYEEIIKAFQSFILKIGFVGMFDIDFYLSEGLLYFGELNLRLGGSGFAIINKGVNLPEMYIRTLLDKSIEDMNRDITGSATYSNERICMHNWFEGNLTNHEYFSLLKSSDVSSVNSVHDIVPMIVFCLKSIKKYMILWKKRMFKGENKE